MSVDLLTLQLCRLSHRCVQPILPVRIIDTVGTEDPEALRGQRSTPYGCGDRGHDLDVSLVTEQLLHGVADKSYADNAGPADLHCEVVPDSKVHPRERQAPHNAPSSCSQLSAGTYPVEWTQGLAARFVGSFRNGFDTPQFLRRVQGSSSSLRHRGESVSR